MYGRIYMCVIYVRILRECSCRLMVGRRTGGGEGGESEPCRDTTAVNYAPEMVPVDFCRERGRAKGVGIAWWNRVNYYRRAWRLWARIVIPTPWATRAKRARCTRIPFRISHFPPPCNSPPHPRPILCVGPEFPLQLLLYRYLPRIPTHADQRQP